MSTYRFFLGIETLFDTVFGFYDLYYPEVILRLDLNRYQHRLHDDLFTIVDLQIDNVEYSQRWESRGDKVLENSFVTPLLSTIKDEVNERQRRSTETPNSQTISITINIWPLSLSEDNKESIALTLASFFGVPSIDVVSISYETLTPKYIKQNIDYFTISDFNKWIGYHHETYLQTCPTPSVQCIAPIKIIDAKQESEIHSMGGEIDFNGTLKRVCAPILSLELLPLSFFSSWKVD